MIIYTHLVDAQAEVFGDGVGGLGTQACHHGRDDVIARVLARRAGVATLTALRGKGGGGLMKKGNSRKTGWVA